jgi:hypothetical protein
MNDLESASVVEGYFLAAQLRATLEEKFGDKWFNSREAGSFLKDLWKPGHEMTTLAVANKLGFDGVDPSSLVADVAEGIKTN